MPEVTVKVIPRASVLVIPQPGKRGRVFRKGHPTEIAEPIPDEVTRAIARGALIVVSEPEETVADEFEPGDFDNGLDAGFDTDDRADDAIDDESAALVETPVPMKTAPVSHSKLSPASSHKGRGRQRKG